MIAPNRYVPTPRRLTFGTFGFPRRVVGRGGGSGAGSGAPERGGGGGADTAER